MEYTTYETLLNALIPLGCRGTRASEDYLISVIRQLNDDVQVFQDSVLYLGREADFIKVSFPANCYGVMIPEKISFDEVYARLETVYNQSHAGLTALSRLTGALWKGNSLQKIVDLAAEIFGNPVTINDFTFQPLASQEQISADTVSPRLREEFITAAKTYQSIWYDAHRELVDDNRPQIHSMEGHKWILCAVKIERVTVAWIVVSQFYRELTDHDLDVVQILRNVISTYFANETDYNNTAGKHQDIFLRDLLTGTFASREVMERTKRQIHFSAYDEYCMIAFQWRAGTPDNSSVHSILQQLRLLMPNNPTIFHERYFAFLLGKKQDTGGFLNSNYTLREFLVINNLQGAMSQPFSDLLQAPKYFDQAIFTLEALGKFYPNELLIRYGLNLSIQMVHALAKITDIRLLCHPALDVLLAYDEANSTELTRTLSVYLNTNSSPSATSNALYIHRNTLNKRLGKIRELTGVDLSDGNVITQLGMAFTIKHYLEVNKL